MFEQKGVVTIIGPVEEDQLLEASWKAVSHMSSEKILNQLRCLRRWNLETLSQTLKHKGFAVSEVELHWVPSTVEVE